MPADQMRIGVTMRVMATQGYHEPRDALAQNWPAFLNTALPDAAWLLLPNLGALSIRAYCEQWGINRLILTGGEDPGISPIRDETERDLLAWSEARHVPTLGVCRGMQLMATYAGGALKPVEGHVRRRHVLRGDFNYEVNSFHNYGLASCPQGFAVCAISEDGEIEAISNASLRWEGWMWHPEREAPFNRASLDRLRVLFE